jgi:hypothetical protein
MEERKRRDFPCMYMEVPILVCSLHRVESKPNRYLFVGGFGQEGQVLVEVKTFFFGLWIQENPFLLVSL